MKQSKKSPLKLNLGCGLDKRAGWVNIDAVPEVKPDLLHDLHQPLPFADHSVDKVLAQDILEHFTKEDGARLVAEISRVLKPGGQLEVRVPNVDAIVTQFADDPEVRNEFLYGTTRDTGVFGAHKVGFTAETLVTIMLKFGLSLRQLKVADTNFWAVFEKSARQKELNSLTLINQTLGMGGAEVFLTDLLVTLQTKGVKIRVFTTNPQWVKLLKSRSLGASHIPIIIDIIGDWKGLVKACFLSPFAFLYYGKLVWQERQTDLILLSGFPEKIVVSWWAWLVRRPVVWIEFGPLQSVFKKFFRLPKLLYYTAKKLPEKIIVPTWNTHHRLIEQAHVSLAKLEVVPCGRLIDVPRRKKAVKNTQSLIVCVSRLEPGKGQDLLIRALPLVLKKVPTARVQIVGEGDFEGQLRQITADLKLQDHVQFLGRVADQLTVMANARVCVFPSMWPLEGFGLVMIEAMAVGTPIIGFDHAPTNEIIQHENTGLLAEDGKVEDLAHQIIRILTDKKLRDQLAKNGQQTFTEKYHLELLGERYYEVLRDAWLKWQVRQSL